MNAERVKVLFWSEIFWPRIGGAEVGGLQLVEALRARGYDIAVIASQDEQKLPAEENHHGIPIYRFPFREAIAARKFALIRDCRLRLGQLKRTLAPDLIHISAAGPSAAFYLQTEHIHPAPMLATLRWEVNSPARPDESLFGRMLLGANWVTSVSALVLEDVRRWAPQITARSSVIFNGLEVPAAPPRPPAFDPPRILCLGRLVTLKGFDLALTAFAQVVRDFPQARLVIAGDGPERAALERQAAELGLGALVEFTGWIAPSDVPQMLQRAAVVLMPSRTEGLPRVALEAASQGRPLVAARAGGVPEVVVHQETGLLVEPEDPAAIFEAVSYLLSYPEAAARMGQAAWQRAREQFSLEVCVDAYDALYQRLVREARSRQPRETPA